MGDNNAGWQAFVLLVLGFLSDICYTHLGPISANNGTHAKHLTDKVFCKARFQELLYAISCLTNIHVAKIAQSCSLVAWLMSFAICLTKLVLIGLRITGLVSKKDDGARPMLDQAGAMTISVRSQCSVCCRTLRSRVARQHVTCATSFLPWATST